MSKKRIKKPDTSPRMFRVFGSVSAGVSCEVLATSKEITDP